MREALADAKQAEAHSHPYPEGHDRRRRHASLSLPSCIAADWAGLTSPPKRV